MSAIKREEVRPCFCGKGRLLESWFDGNWSAITLQCAACDQLYEFKVVERAQDGTERTAWVKRTSELKRDLPEGRANPLLSTHDFTGQPVHASLFGSKFAADSVGHVFTQPSLTDLKHFDSVGSLYVMKSKSIPDFLKIGVTTRPLNQRARENTKDFCIEHPFEVTAAWRMRNYLMVEYFLLRRLIHLRSRYIKARMYFREIRHRKLCVRTHRSAELYKCAFEEAYSQISLILNKAPEVQEFEQWLLDWLTPRLESFRHQQPEETKLISAWQFALDTVKRRLNAGETSMCALETLDPIVG